MRTWTKVSARAILLTAGFAALGAGAAHPPGAYADLASGGGNLVSGTRPALPLSAPIDASGSPAALGEFTSPGHRRLVRSPRPGTEHPALTDHNGPTGGNSLDLPRDAGTCSSPIAGKDVMRCHEPHRAHKGNRDHKAQGIDGTVSGTRPITPPDGGIKTCGDALPVLGDTAALCNGPVHSLAGNGQHRADPGEHDHDAEDLAEQLTAARAEACGNPVNVLGTAAAGCTPVSPTHQEPDRSIHRPEPPAPTLPDAHIPPTIDVPAQPELRPHAKPANDPLTSSITPDLPDTLNHPTQSTKTNRATLTPQHPDAPGYPEPPTAGNLPLDGLTSQLPIKPTRLAASPEAPTRPDGLAHPDPHAPMLALSEAPEPGDLPSSLPEQPPIKPIKPIGPMGPARHELPVRPDLPWPQVPRGSGRGGADEGGDVVSGVSVRMPAKPVRSGGHVGPAVPARPEGLVPSGVPAPQVIRGFGRSGSQGAAGLGPGPSGQVPVEEVGSAVPVELGIPGRVVGLLRPGVEALVGIAGTGPAAVPEGLKGPHFKERGREHASSVPREATPPGLGARVPMFDVDPVGEAVGTGGQGLPDASPLGSVPGGPVPDIAGQAPGVGRPPLDTVPGQDVGAPGTAAGETGQALVQKVTSLSPAGVAGTPSGDEVLGAVAPLLGVVPTPDATEDVPKVAEAGGVVAAVDPLSGQVLPVAGTAENVTGAAAHDVPGKAKDLVGGLGRTQPVAGDKPLLSGMGSGSLWVVGAGLASALSGLLVALRRSRPHS